MEGIRYATDETSKRRFVQIDLDRFGGDASDELLESLVAESRRREESVPLAEARAYLRGIGKLTHGEPPDRAPGSSDG